MKKDTITITRAEYEQLNKAANAAVEHACNLFKAARLVDELEAEASRFAADNNELRDEIDRLEAERDKLEVEEEDMKTWRKVLARQAHYTDAAWDK